MLMILQSKSYYIHAIFLSVYCIISDSIGMRFTLYAQLPYVQGPLTREFFEKSEIWRLGISCLAFCNPKQSGAAFLLRSDLLRSYYSRSLAVIVLKL